MKTVAAREEKTERGGRGEAPRDAEGVPRASLPVVRLGDVVSFEYGESLPQQARNVGAVPVYGSNGVVGQHDRAVTTGPTIIVGRKGSVGKIHYSPVPCFPIDTAYFIRVRPQVQIDALWLSFSLRALGLDRLKTATGVPGLNRDDAYALSIPLPPLAEQERIAGRLTEQLAAVERARGAAQSRLVAAESLPAAYLREVFEGPEASGWETVPLGELCDGNGQYGTSAKSNGQQRGLPVLGMPHIHEGRIRWAKVFYADLPPDEMEKYRLVKGDLLFNRTNSAELVGKTAVFDGTREAVFASYLIRFRVREDRADSRFVSAYINSRQGRVFIERHMARAVGQVNISASTMSVMPIPCPPADRQREIMDRRHLPRLAGAERLAEGIRAQLAAIEALPAALLREAFGGPGCQEQGEKA